MATWQPPIPAGALYSKPARQLGAALALLAYCYDIVQRDGWFELRLVDVAGDLDTDYRTMRRWWQDVKNGPFFQEVIDHGRNGVRVRFKDGWLDWRILQARQPKDYAEQSKPDERTETTLQDTEGQMKAKSKPNERSTVSLHTTAYKEDIHDQKTDSTLRAKRAPPPGDHQRLMAMYAEVLGYKLTTGPQEAVAIKKILAAGYTPEQTIEVYQILKADQFYEGKHLSLQTVYKQMGAVLAAPKERPNGRGNGRHNPADTRPSLPVVKPVTDRPDQRASMKALAEEARKRHDRTPT